MNSDRADQHGHGSHGIQAEKPLPPWEMPGAFRLDCEPHRGTLLYWMAAASLFWALAPVPPFVWGVLSPPLSLTT